jgi:CHAT domain-containing protein/tetratricopeptide (TPR) repeat protein
MKGKFLVLLLLNLLLGKLAVAQEQKQMEDSMMYYYGNNNFLKAIYWGEKNAEAVKQQSGGQDTLYGTAINNLAQFYTANRDHHSAKPLLIKAAEIYKNVLGEKDQHYSFLLKNLGSLHTKLAEYTDAETCIQRSLQLQKETTGEKNIEYATTLNELAFLYKTIGKYGDAEILYNRALVILKEVAGEEHLEYLSILNNLATVYYQTGRYALTEKMFFDIAALKKKLLGENDLDYANSLNNLGVIYYALGNYNAAEPNLSKALSIYETKLGKGNPQNVGAMGNLGALNQQLEQFAKAELFIKEQIAIFEASIGKNTIEYAGAINNLAYNNLKSGKDSATEQMFKEALGTRKNLLGINHFDYIQSLNNLALYYTKKSKFALADSLYKEALKIQQQNVGYFHPDYLLFANNQCELYQLMHNYSAAAAAALTNLSKEESLLVSKLDFLTEKELIAYIKNKEFSFSLPYASLLHYKEPALIQAAYNNCLLLKGIAVQNTSLLFRQMAQSADSTLVLAWKNYKSNRSLYNKTLAQPIAKRIIDADSLNNIVNQQEKALVQQSAGYKSLKERQNIKWQQVQKKLLPSETAIEFVRFRYINDQLDYNYYYAALLLRAQDSVPVFIKLGGEKELQLAMNSFAYKAPAVAAAQNNKEVSAVKNIKTAVYNLVWQPLEPYLSKTTTIYFAPDGLLYQLAFAAIPNKNGSLLCDRFNLVQLTSTRQVAIKDSAVLAPASIALFGGINYNKQSTDTLTAVSADPYAYVYRQNRSAGVDSFTYLPGTLKEIESIKKSMEAKQKKVAFYSGVMATEAAFRNTAGIGSPAVIHFATHGFTLPDAAKLKTGSVFKISDNPLLRSGLVLSGGNKGWKGNSNFNEDDGILTALEITAVSLANTQLTVLSACETGTGQLQGSEGVFGLQRAFKLAGVNYVMASLWQVPDKETAEFMNNFYSNWLAGKTIRQAFSATQQTMRKKYAPYYWASFTLLQ